MVHRGPKLDELTAKMQREVDARLASLADQIGVDWGALQPHAGTTRFANQLFQIPQDEPFRNWEVCSPLRPESPKHCLGTGRCVGS